MQQSFNKKAFSKAVRLKRKEMKVGLRPLAKHIGISYTSVMRIEKKLTTPDINNILTVCNWLGQSICDFIIVKP